MRTGLCSPALTLRGSGPLDPALIVESSANVIFTSRRNMLPANKRFMAVSVSRPWVGASLNLFMPRIRRIVDVSFRKACRRTGSFLIMGSTISSHESRRIQRNPQRSSTRKSTRLYRWTRLRDGGDRDGGVSGRRALQAGGAFEERGETEGVHGGGERART